MKICFKCNETKEYSEFYKHKATKDGYLGKCKECTKKDVKDNYQDRIEQYKEYYCKRSVSGYRREEKLQYQREYRQQYPERNRAHYLVQEAIKNGSISPQPCFICGNVAEAHHPDYSDPLGVVWLCSKHHKEAHKLVN